MSFGTFNGDNSVLPPLHMARCPRITQRETLGSWHHWLARSQSTLCACPPRRP